MTKRSTAFFINGGAGRVIASIPALEKFRKKSKFRTKPRKIKFAFVPFLHIFVF